MAQVRWRPSSGVPPFAIDSPTGFPAVYFLRGDRAESAHAVAACVADADGSVLYSMGNTTVPVFIRSCAKPFIAGAVLRAGAMERYGLTQAEIAVMSGSHDGEPHHVSAVRAILSKAGIPEDALRCGGHAPRDEESAAALRTAGKPFSEVHNNCSGKHAGLLILARLLAADLEGYLEPSHPVQRCVVKAYARLFGRSANSLELAVDGCGVPVVAVSLRELATAYARLVTLNHLDDRDAKALDSVCKSMLSHPQYAGGTRHFDTLLMRAMEGTLISKRGAEGVHASGSLSSRMGIAVKVIDGSMRALPGAVVSVLDRLDLLHDVSDRTLADLTPLTIRNLTGAIVGRIVTHLPESDQFESRV